MSNRAWDRRRVNQRLRSLYRKPLVEGWIPEEEMRAHIQEARRDFLSRRRKAVSGEDLVEALVEGLRHLQARDGWRVR